MEKAAAGKKGFHVAGYELKILKCLNMTTVFIDGKIMICAVCADHRNKNVLGHCVSFAWTERGHSHHALVNFLVLCKGKTLSHHAVIFIHLLLAVSLS